MPQFAIDKSLSITYNYSMIKIEGYKKDSMLTFVKEGYQVRYDLKDGRTYKNTNNKGWREVANIKDFFVRQDPDNVIENFRDIPYQVFMRKIQQSEHRCSNVGTFLERLRKYAHLENYSLLDLNFQRNVNKPLSFYNKDVIRAFKHFNIEFTVNVESAFRDYSEYLNNILVQKINLVLK